MIVSVLWQKLNLRFTRLRTCRGKCDPPDAKDRTIRVDSRLEGQELMEVLLHEITHAASWPIDEDFIAQFARDAARILTDCGFTHQADGGKGRPKA